MRYSPSGTRIPRTAAPTTQPWEHTPVRGSLRNMARANGSCVGWVVRVERESMQLEDEQLRDYVGGRGGDIG
eukprot:8824402-Pyramimonas_sp.AAC.1